MINPLSTTVVSIVVIALIIVIFIAVTIINLKTKKPDLTNDEECNACASRDTCPIIIRETKIEDGENSE
ncbi:MAG: hypothetical protein K6G38_05455 [Gammaproteobacteria bacterium]|nr:hypothetical protein [Gammaproteobacteria bacterium]